MKKLISAAIAVGLSASAASADVVIFKNGDKLTGTVVELIDGKLRLKSPAVGEVLIDTLDISTFSTDNLIDLQLADGSIVKQKVDSASDGRIAIIGPGGATEYDIAQLKSINPRTGWKGNIRGGLVVQNGNTKSEDYYLAFDVFNRMEQDRYTIGGNYNLSRSRDARNPDSDRVTTADNWRIFGQWDHFFDDKLYGYGRLQVDRDRIANLKYRISPGVGLGYQWVEGPVWNFNTEAGVGYVYEKYKDPGDDPNFDDTDEYVAVRLAYHYDRKVVDNLLIFHNFELLPSVEDPCRTFQVNSDIGLRANFTTNLFAEFKFEWRHDSQPAAGSQKDDLKYIAALGWTF
ncbi:MAG: DUF481 domain-containing protein [Phycisphaerae bacterium]|nr:DUF481 domain-containing protein [Phycisphaerae bacterium]MDW8263131.1 DUF481 domain-containing protein [Phycisphaerales bacterium]